MKMIFATLMISILFVSQNATAAERAYLRCVEGTGRDAAVITFFTDRLEIERNGEVETKATRDSNLCFDGVVETRKLEFSTDQRCRMVWYRVKPGKRIFRLDSCQWLDSVGAR